MSFGVQMSSVWRECKDSMGASPDVLEMTTLEPSSIGGAVNTVIDTTRSGRLLKTSHQAFRYDNHRVIIKLPDEMNLVAAFTVALWSNLLPQSSSTFYLEIPGSDQRSSNDGSLRNSSIKAGTINGSSLSSLKSNILRNGTLKEGAEIHDSLRSEEFDDLRLKAGLYRCDKVAEEKDKETLRCKAVWVWEKVFAYSHANFFVVGNAQLKTGQSLFIDGKMVDNLPEIVALGFFPREVDSPDLETHPRCHETGNAVSALTFTNYLPDEEESAAALTEYLCCSDVQVCILSDVDRARDMFLPAVRHVLTRCISQHRSARKLKSKRTPKDYLSSSFLSSKTTKNAKPVGDSQSKMVERDQLEAVVKVMMNILIDPCILLRSTTTEEGLAAVNYTCKLFCQFLGLAAELFGHTIALKCNFLKDGSCDRGVCSCIQAKTRKTVKMLYCDNKFRLNLTPISQCLA